MTMPIPKFVEGKVVDPTSKIDKSKLKGQSVVVTGGAAGLGEHFVRRFAEAG